MLYRTSESNNRENLLDNDIFDTTGNSHIQRLMNENILGIGIYSCPDLRLLKSNENYSKNVHNIYYQEEDIRFKGSEFEGHLSTIMNTNETTYLDNFKTLTDKDEARYWTGSLTPITKGENVKFIIVTLKEITDLILIQQQLKESNEKSRTLVEWKDESLLLITHELKTPLAVISSIIQAIEINCKIEASDQLSKYLKIIKQNTNQQLKMVNNILDSARMNPDLYQLNLSDIEIIRFTKTIINSIKTIAEEKEIRISFSSPMTEFFLESDIDIYERILVNLLSNAIKFSAEGEPVKVNIFQLKSNLQSKICIQVIDNGIGIPNNQKSLIFERFRRCNNQNISAEGSGIGLYLVKMLACLLGGEIKLKSREGVGSTFSLILPIKYSKAING